MIDNTIDLVHALQQQKGHETVTLDGVTYRISDICKDLYGYLELYKEEFTATYQDSLNDLKRLEFKCGQR